MPGVGPVDGDVDDRPNTVAVMVGDVLLPHELAVAHQNGVPVDLGADTVSADLLNIRHPAAVDLPAIGPLQAFADGVAGSALRQSGVLHQLLVLHLMMVDAVDLKHALGQGAGLVKDHRFGLGQSLQIVRALYQYAGVAGPADAGKEAERDADDQSAGTAGHQEGEGPVDPDAPAGGQAQKERPGQRDQDGQGQGGETHSGGIHPGEPGDEVLRPRLAGGGVLHQVQDLGHRGLAEFPGGTDFQQPGHVDAAADDLVPLPDLPGQGLAGEGGGIQGGGALHHSAVDRNLLAGLDHNNGADGHLVRVYLLQLPVLFHVGVVRADVHQLTDVPAAPAYCIALEPLADLIEQHDGDGLGVIPAPLVQGQGNGAHSGHGHQEVLVEHLAVLDALQGLSQDVVTCDQIGDQVQPKPHPACDGENMQDSQQGRRCQNADQHDFLLFIHEVHFRSEPLRAADNSINV